MNRDVKEALERLRPTLGSRTDALWALVLSGDRRAREEFERELLLLDLARNETGPGNGPPPLPPPPPGVLGGWLEVGDVVYPNLPPAPFGLNKGELIQHVAIFGRSGAGKTNTVLGIIKQLLKTQTKFLIFDWKRNYRDVLAAPWVPEGEVAAFTAGRDIAPLHLNPLRPPPGTDPRTWLKKLIEVLAHAYFLGEGVMFILQEALDEAYRRFGVYEGSGRYPTFHDIHSILKARKVTGREANWMASTLRATGSLTYGPTAETLSSANQTDIRSLLDQNVILELDALTDADKVFLVETLLLYIHHIRLAEPERETLKHVLLVEEAHHVFLRSKQEASGGEPITDVILREIRELGEAVILVDQHPSQIAITALGNTYCTIAMNLKHRADVTTVADACLLDLEQREHVGRLPVGTAIVKLQDRWVSPFMVRFPLIPIEKGGVSDDLLRVITAMRKLELWPKRPRLVPIKEIPVPLHEREEIPEIPARPKESQTQPPLQAVERKFLEDVVSHPASGVTQRYGRLGLSRRGGTERKTALLQKGLLAEVPLPLPGGRLTLLEPTKSAWLVLGRNPPSPREGGILHRYWLERAAERFRNQGMKVEIESPVGNGRTIDLLAESETERIAVEIEVSGRRLDESVQKLKGVNVERRLLLSTNNEILERARELGPGIAGIEIRHVWSILGSVSPKSESEVGAKERKASPPQKASRNEKEGF